MLTFLGKAGSVYQVFSVRLICAGKGAGVAAPSPAAVDACATVPGKNGPTWRPAAGGGRRYGARLPSWRRPWLGAPPRGFGRFGGASGRFGRAIVAPSGHWPARLLARAWRSREPAIAELTAAALFQCAHIND